MPNQHTVLARAAADPRRPRMVRFTDAEWQEIKQGAQALGETRSEAIRAGGLSRVRQAIADVSDFNAGQFRAAGLESRPIIMAAPACVYCKRFTDMQDSIPAVGGGSAHTACALRASLAVAK